MKPVVVVDDDDHVRPMIVAWFKSMNVEILDYANPEEFLNEYKPGMASIVFVDMIMPEMSGIEVIERLRKVDSEVAIILVTGYGASVDTEGTEPDIVLAKPFSLKDIKEIVSKYGGNC